MMVNSSQWNMAMSICGKSSIYPWILGLYRGTHEFITGENWGGTAPNNGYWLTSVKVSAEPVFGVLGDAWSTMVRGFICKNLVEFHSMDFMAGENGLGLPGETHIK